MGWALSDAREINFLPVVANGSHNLQCQCQCAATVIERYNWRGALSNSPKERFEFRVQRLLGRNRGLGDSNLRICGRIRGRRAILTDGEDQHLLASVVERNVLPRLKKTQLAHSFGR